jgi:hypothetical protein
MYSSEADIDGYIHEQPGGRGRGRWRSIDLGYRAGAKATEVADSKPEEEATELFIHGVENSAPDKVFLFAVSRQRLPCRSAVPKKMQSPMADKTLASAV